MATETPGRMGSGNPVHWFEIPASDLARARSFYEKVLGVELTPIEQGAIRMAWFPRRPDAHGSAGGLIEGDDRAPSRVGTLVYLTVDDIDATLARVGELGGTVVLPRTAFDQGAVAKFVDSEGNLVALFSAGG